MKSEIIGQGNSALSIFNEKGEIVGMPRNMFGDDPRYRSEVRNSLEQYGTLVKGGNPQLEESFKRLIENWRPANFRRQFGGVGAADFYDNAEDAGLTDDSGTSKRAAALILRFMIENDVDNSFKQKMFNEIWRDSGSFNISDDDGNLDAWELLSTRMFAGGQAVANRARAKKRSIETSNEVADGLMGVARQLFGENGSFDISDVNSLYIFETALNKASNSDKQLNDKDKLTCDEVMSKLILSYCKKIVVYWSDLENLKRIPADKRQILLRCAEYVKNPRHDFTPEQLGNKQLPLFGGNKLSTFVNQYPIIQQNLAKASVDTLDGDYVDYDLSQWDMKRPMHLNPKRENPHGYYDIETRLQLAEHMPDKEACQYYIDLINQRGRKYGLQHTDACDNESFDYDAIRIFRLIVNRTKDPQQKLEYLKKWMAYECRDIFTGISDENLIFADDIRTGKISASTISTFDKEKQDIAMTILERSRMVGGMRDVQGENPLETAHTSLSKRALRGIIDYHSKITWGNYDTLLEAIDTILDSENYAVSAKQMRETLGGIYVPISEEYKKKASDEFYVENPEYLETSFYGKRKNRLEPYMSRLTERIKTEGQLQNRIAVARPEIVNPVLRRFTGVLNRVALLKSQQANSEMNGSK